MRKLALLVMLLLPSLAMPQDIVIGARPRTVGGTSYLWEQNFEGNQATLADYNSPGNFDSGNMVGNSATAPAMDGSFWMRAVPDTGVFEAYANAEWTATDTVCVTFNFAVDLPDAAPTETNEPFHFNAAGSPVNPLLEIVAVSSTQFQLRYVCEAFSANTVTTGNLEDDTKYKIELQYVFSTGVGQLWIDDASIGTCDGANSQTEATGWQADVRDHLSNFDNITVDDTTCP